MGAGKSVIEVKSMQRSGKWKIIANNRFFVREKEKWTNKRTDKQYVADFLLYKVHFIITKLCTKFQDPLSSSS